jgi:AraC family transcriptional activator of pobA
MLMYSLSTEKVIPKIPLEPDPRTGNRLFKIRNYDSIVHYRKAELLQPHRKDFYFMAFVREGSSRHWVDMIPYVFKPNTIYFSTPHQVHVKEEAVAITGTIIAFGEEFLALDDTNFLKSLPLIRNPHNGHELNLIREDVLFLEDMLDKIEAESLSDSSWKNQMLLAYLKVLLIYLSRLYTKQYDSKEISPDRVLLKRFQSKINESYQSLH